MVAVETVVRRIGKSWGLGLEAVMVGGLWAGRLRKRG